MILCLPAIANRESEAINKAAPKEASVANGLTS